MFSCPILSLSHCRFGCLSLSFPYLATLCLHQLVAFSPIQFRIRPRRIVVFVIIVVAEVIIRVAVVIVVVTVVIIIVAVVIIVVAVVVVVVNRGSLPGRDEHECGI